MRGVVAGKRLAVGSTALMDEEQVDSQPLRDAADRLRNEGASAMFVAVDSRVLGLLAMADPIKTTTARNRGAKRCRRAGRYGYR